MLIIILVKVDKLSRVYSLNTYLWKDWIGLYKWKECRKQQNFI